MLTNFKTRSRELSLEERILAMNDFTIRNKIPKKLKETGLFSEQEIERAVMWLIEFREQNRLDVIE